MKFLLSRLLMRTGLCRWMRITQPGFVLRFYPSSLSAALWIDPAARLPDMDFLRAYLRPGDTVIDVGANIGNTALAAAAAVGPRGRVLAFEPHPRVFEYLRGNIDLNHAAHVRAYNLALGDRQGRTSLSDGRSDDENRVLPGGQGLPVSMERLDDVFDGESDVSLLKIDVEGYETYVLRGAERVLGVTACVYFEVFEEHLVRHQYTTAELLGFLQERGFSIFNVLPGRRLRRLAGPYVAAECENLLAVRSLDRFVARTGFAVG